MRNDLVLRPATEADVPFIVDCILMAEASGTAVVPYERIFDLSPAELRSLLTEIAAEDYLGLELTYPNFYLLVQDGEPVAGCAAWREGLDENGEPSLPSGALKAQLLAYYLGPDRWQAAAGKLKAVAAVDIPREAGAVQLDAIAVLPQHRGKGLLSELLAGVLQLFQQSAPPPHKAQILLMENNLPALSAYQKAGFTIITQTQSAAPELLTLLPGLGRMLMERMV